jgi:hypothetical protein
VSIIGSDTRGPVPKSVRREGTRSAGSPAPAVYSRSAVTDLAAQIAAELGITVAGYARGGGLTVYTHPARIRNADAQTGGAES